MTRSYVAITWFYLSRFFRSFPPSDIILFYSRFCQKMFLVSRFCFCQQISRFLLSADLVFVSRFCKQFFFVSRFVFRQQMSLHMSAKRRSRRHIQFRASLFLEANIFSSGGRAFSLQSRLRSVIWVSTRIFCSGRSVKCTSTRIFCSSRSIKCASMRIPSLFYHTKKD